MADDDSALASKILLRHAANKSKAKSWLIVSLGSEDQQNPDIPTDTTSQSQSHEANDDLENLRYDDENAGIGSVKKPSDGGADDVLSNRHLASANEALRRRLLSKDAYKKYSQGQKNGGVREPKAIRRRAAEDLDDDDDGEEVKGRSNLGSKKQQNADMTAKDDNAVGSPPTISKATGSSQSSTQEVSRGKKRSGSSYLDQVLAKRQQKGQKKAKLEESRK